MCYHPMGIKGSYLPLYEVGDSALYCLGSNIKEGAYVDSFLTSIYVLNFL